MECGTMSPPVGPPVAPALLLAAPAADGKPKAPGGPPVAPKLSVLPKAAPARVAQDSTKGKSKHDQGTARKRAGSLDADKKKGAHDPIVKADDDSDEAEA